jgi:hypothetical protein
MKKTTGSPYLHWIKKSLAANQPYDQFVHDLLSAEGELFKAGNGAVGYYIRDFEMPLDNMANTLQVFLATSMVCAQCHDHPYKKWTQMDFYKMAAFTQGTVINVKGIDSTFAKQAKKTGADLNKTAGKGRGFEKEMRPFYQGAYNSGSGKIKLPSDYDYDDAKPNETVSAGVPFSPAVEIDFSSDNGARKRIYEFRLDRKEEAHNVNARKFLADWATSPENPMFTKTIVNRLWARMMGASLVGKLTDMKESQMGVNPKLTEYLILLMKKIKYDQKKFMRVIAKTRIYQRQATQQVSGKYYFPGPIMKRLSSEQIWDSLLTLSTNRPDQSAIVPKLITENLIYAAIGSMTMKEKLAYGMNPKAVVSKIKKTLKESSRSKSVSKKLTRASELKSPERMGSPIQIFGQSRRQTIDGANTDATIPQALILLNNWAYNSLEKKEILQDYLKKAFSLTDKINIIYKAVLTRQANSDELALLKSYGDSTQEEDLLNDLFWALINSHEFKTRQ